MTTQTSPTLAAAIFADTLERRFQEMAHAVEINLIPNPEGVMRWLLAAETVASEPRSADVREFGERLMTVFRERAAACACRCIGVDRQDHEKKCGRYVWSRAGWAVQQELAEVDGAAD